MLGLLITDALDTILPLMGILFDMKSLTNLGYKIGNWMTNDLEFENGFCVHAINISRPPLRSLIPFRVDPNTIMVFIFTWWESYYIHSPTLFSCFMTVELSIFVVSNAIKKLVDQVHAQHVHLMCSVFRFLRIPSQGLEVYIFFVCMPLPILRKNSHFGT
jgi:hypothetical protein